MITSDIYFSHRQFLLGFRGGNLMEGKLKLVIAMLIYGSIGVFVKNIKLSALEIALILGATYFIDKNGLMSFRSNGQLENKRIVRNKKAVDNSISQSYFINHYQKML